MIQITEIMTEDPTCCTPDSSLEEVAKMMADEDCGSIPVVDNKGSMKPIGTITDRDIVCRTVAQGLNPLTLKVSDAMSQPVITVSYDSDLDEACRLMEQHQIRRVPVVNNQGILCGIVSQADIAEAASGDEAGELVKEVSKATSNSSNA